MATMTATLIIRRIKGHRVSLVQCIYFFLAMLLTISAYWTMHLVLSSCNFLLTNDDKEEEEEEGEEGDEGVVDKGETAYKQKHE